MSPLKSKPPTQTDTALDAFVSGVNRPADASTTQPLPSLETYPWEVPGIREDVLKVYNLRLPEPYLLKLKYIAQQTPHSMQQFCLDHLLKAIDQQVATLSRPPVDGTD